MLSAVATRYAKALVDVVAEPDSDVHPSQVLGELNSVRQLIAGSPALRNALLSPAVSPSKKRGVMRRLLDPLNIHPKVRNFMYVVIDHRRVGDFDSIVEAFEVLLDERLGYVRADVTSAAELLPAQRAALEAEVARLAGKKAKLNFSVNPGLIAGVIARVGSRVYDGSVRGQLERLRTRLGRG
jgi:F-type H+-transporting ATPase subunit delta